MSGNEEYGCAVFTLYVWHNRETQRYSLILMNYLMKGIVRESGGNAVQLAYTMEFIFNVEPNETIFCASDIGWVYPLS